MVPQMRKYLITPNVILNCSISGKDSFRAYKILVKKLLDLFLGEEIEFYMSEFDFFMAFVAPLLCGFYGCRLYFDLYIEIVRRIRICKIDDCTLETASMFYINPTDALRLAVALEGGFDGIITWEPLHFIQQSSQSKQEEEARMSRYGKGEVFVAWSDDIETGEHLEIRLFVASLESFLRGEESGDTDCPPEERLPFYKFYMEDLSVDNSTQKEVVEVALIDDYKSIKRSSSSGGGTVSTLFQAINGCIRQYTTLPIFDEVLYSVPPFNNIDGEGEVHISIMIRGQEFKGVDRSSDLLRSSANAYLDAINRMLSSFIVHRSL